MRYHVRHITTYRYAEAFSECFNQARLTPRNTPVQRLVRAELFVEPTPDEVVRHTDSFGNVVDSFTIHSPGSTLQISSQCTVDLVPARSSSLFMSTPWESVRDLLAGSNRADALDAMPMLFDSPHAPATKSCADYAAASFTPGRPVCEAAADLCSRIFADFKYETGSTEIGTSVDELLKSRRGVCQDFAHLMIACLRSLGLPGRYVSGYLRTIAPPGKEKLVGADASHAWCSTWCPTNGWLDFDPTNNVTPTDSHITLAWGRDFADVSPIKGVIHGGGEHTVDVAVDVVPGE